MAENKVGYGDRIVIRNAEHNIGGAIMKIEAGKKTDMCFHIYNKKVMYVLSGKVKVTVIQEGQMKAVELVAGSSFFVKEGFMSQMEAVEDSVVVELPSDANKLYGDSPDRHIISKGTQVESEQSEEPGSAVLMTEEDKANAEVEEKPKTKRRSRKKKTTKRATRTKS